METTEVAPADALVIFGITGDLARRMTYRALQPLLDRPPPIEPYPRGSFGPTSAEMIVRGSPGWRYPWLPFDRVPALR